MHGCKVTFFERYFFFCLKTQFGSVSGFCCPVVVRNLAHLMLKCSCLSLQWKNLLVINGQLILGPFAVKTYHHYSNTDPVSAFRSTWAYRPLDSRWLESLSSTSSSSGTRIDWLSLGKVSWPNCCWVTFVWLTCSRANAETLRSTAEKSLFTREETGDQTSNLLAPKIGFRDSYGIKRWGGLRHGEQWWEVRKVR